MSEQEQKIHVRLRDKYTCDETFDICIEGSKDGVDIYFTDATNKNNDCFAYLEFYKGELRFILHADPRDEDCNPEPITIGFNRKRRKNRD